MHHSNETEEIAKMLKDMPFKHTIQTEKIYRFYGIYIFEIYWYINTTNDIMQHNKSINKNRFNWNLFKVIHP